MNLTKIATALDLLANEWPSTQPLAPAASEDIQASLQASLGDRYTPDLGEKIASDQDLRELFLDKAAAAPSPPRPFGTPVERRDIEGAPMSAKEARAAAMDSWGESMMDLARR